MTDRELLELAARAAGHDTSHKWNAERLSLDPPVIALCIPGVSTGWDPLQDDGDALRLAAKLNLSICYTLGDINAPWGTAMAGFSPWNNASPIASVRYQTYKDKMAATRRAIVRAAAQIQLNKEAANE